MKITLCDVGNCKKKANQNLDVCHGWTESESSSIGSEKRFKPFQRPHTMKYDLCETHFKKWCRATYVSMYGKVK